MLRRTYPNRGSQGRCYDIRKFDFPDKVPHTWDVYPLSTRLGCFVSNLTRTSATHTRGNTTRHWPGLWSEWASDYQAVINSRPLSCMLYSFATHCTNDLGRFEEFVRHVIAPYLNFTKVRRDWDGPLPSSPTTTSSGCLQVLE